MKKSKNMVLIISTALIVVGVILSSILTNQASVVSTIVTSITAIIGAVALWIQFRKDHEVNQASFIIEFYKSFNENESCVKVLNVLDDRFDGKPTVKLETIKHDVLNYLSWIRTLCNLIERNIIDFEAIDETFSYKFFSIVDCKEVQDMEIARFPYLYNSFFRVHKSWTEYRKKHGKFNNTYNDEDLSLLPMYKEYSK